MSVHASPDDRRLTHTEWNGWLFCEPEKRAFGWQTGTVECPYCGTVFENPESDDDGAGVLLPDGGRGVSVSTRGGGDV